jgi:hypothetical protein
MTTYCILDSLTTTPGEASLPASTAQRGGLREIDARGRGPGLRSGDLSGQACSWRQEASYSFAMISLSRTTVRLAFSQAPEHIKGKEYGRLGTPRSCDSDVGFSQAPEHVEGGVYSMRKEEVVLDSE